MINYLEKMMMPLTMMTIMDYILRKLQLQRKDKKNDLKTYADYLLVGTHIKILTDIVNKYIYHHLIFDFLLTIEIDLSAERNIFKFSWNNLFASLISESSYF